MDDRYNAFVVDGGFRFVLAYIQRYLIRFRHEDKFHLPITSTSLSLSSGQVAPQLLPLFSLY
jgi:hypothetical protein